MTSSSNPPISPIISMNWDYENDSDYSPGVFNDCESMRDQLQYLSDPFYKEPHKRTFITALYSTVALVGAVGNLMVIAAVLRNAQMRTPRNYFIINLALSDLLMCICTVPFTMYYVLNQFWDLGSTACKVVASAQGVNIFVSTMSITAIGLDRYWVILFPTKTEQQRCVIAVCFSAIWIFSLLLASPLFYATDATLPVELQEAADKCGLILFVCSENWYGMIIDKGAYSISSTVFQYVLPLTMLTFVYTRIIRRLETRMVHRQRAMATNPYEYSAGGSSSAGNNRRTMEQRQRRTNLLLICLVAFFAICWFPLNVYNGLSSFELAQYNVLVFVTCHAFGMTSALANPILYGVFNENFRSEFIGILTSLKIASICGYLAKRISPGQSGGGGGRCSWIDQENRPSVTSTTKIGVHPAIKQGSAIWHRRSDHSRRPSVARFHKFVEIDPEPASWCTVGLDGDCVKVGRLVSPTENGKCALTLFDQPVQAGANNKTEMKKENETGELMVEKGPIGEDDRREGRRSILEERIPLFWDKSMISGGPYVLDAQL